MLDHNILTNNDLMAFIKFQFLQMSPNTHHRGLSAYDICGTSLILVDVNRATVNTVTARTFSKFIFKDTSKHKILKHGRFSLFFYNIPYDPEFGISSIPILGSLHNFVLDKVSFFQGLNRVWGTPNMNAFIINFLTIIVDCFGMKTLTSWISILARIYALILDYTGFRKENSYSPEFNVTDIASVLVAFGLPDSIVKACREFQLFTSLRVQTGSFVVTCLRMLFDVIKVLLNYLVVHFKSDLSQKIIDFLDVNFGFFMFIEYIEKINVLYTKYCANSQNMLNLQYRTEVLELDAKIGFNIQFNEWLSVNERRAQKELYHAFKNNIVKYAKNFTTSSRTEPVCIVFEGPAGCRKSTIMNLFTQVCKSMDRSVYTHTIPSVDAGKDFYDDYENQNVFVIDDIGQQGLSQWRAIINLVSPVKFPLECAAAEKKNTKFFNSELIMCTTNLLMGIPSFTSKDCIGNREALFRRCHVFKFCSTTKYDVQYNKFDYLDSLRWKSEFIDSMKGFNHPVKFEGAFDNVMDTDALLVWMYKIVKEAETRNKDFAQAAIVTPIRMNGILDQIKEVYHDALRPESFVTDVIYESTAYVFDWTSTLSECLVSNVNSVCAGLMNLVASSEIDIAVWVGRILCTSLLSYVLYNNFLRPVDNDLGTLRELKNVYTPQNLILDDASRQHLISVKDHCFFAEIRSTIGGVKTTGISQCVISGEYILLNDHAVGDYPVLNVYRTWEDYERKNMLFNNLPVVIHSRLLKEDLVILKCIKFPITPISYYKWPTDSDVSFNNTRDTYVVNCNMCKPLVLHGNCAFSGEVIKYGLSDKQYDIPAGQAVEYNLSGKGLCGSLLVTSAGIPLGHHVAGDSVAGVGVVKLWSRETRILLKKLFAGNTVEYTPVFKELNDFSGMRFFQTDLKSSRIPSRTSYISSPLDHLGEDSEVITMREELEELPFVIPKCEKGPVNLNAFGADTIHVRSAKSFKPIPSLGYGEREFAKACLRTMFIKFSKVDDITTAFGGEGLNEMNKRTVNGYGYSKDKKDYFDYEKKEIKPVFYERLNSFKESVARGDIKVSDILCVESLKDELRNVDKINKPRCFRILPLHHTFLVKQYVGNLFRHIVKNMWSNGIAIGMNPFKDFARMHSILKSKKGHFDGDFGDYDGSAPSELQDDIAEVVMEFFEGTEEDKKIFSVLLNSMIRSWVLTKEKLHLTTHSLPSGCWVTALFNSFLNRMLTAICLYRNKKSASIVDFCQISDFVLGDDKLVGTPSHLVDAVNALTMRDVAVSLGMTYTDARKGEITSPFKPLEECQFLKRTFVFHSALKKVVGVLDINTIVETLRFYDSTKEMAEVMNGKMTAVQFELFLYGNYGSRLLNFLKDRARVVGVEFTEFSPEIIARTMLEDETYAALMMIQSKYFSSNY